MEFAYDRINSVAGGDDEKRTTVRATSVTLLFCVHCVVYLAGLRK